MYVSDCSHSQFKIKHLLLLLIQVCLYSIRHQLSLSRLLLKPPVCIPLQRIGSVYRCAAEKTPNFVQYMKHTQIDCIQSSRSSHATMKVARLSHPICSTCWNRWLHSTWRTQTRGGASRGKLGSSWQTAFAGTRCKSPPPHPHKVRTVWESKRYSP